MAETVIESGHLAPGEEDDFLDIGLIAEESFPHPAEADAVNADDFDFQLGGGDNSEDPGIQYHQASNNTEIAGMNLAEPEIGYEDEDEYQGEPTALDPSHQTAALPTNKEAVQGTENQDEINYGEEDDEVEGVGEGVEGEDGEAGEDEAEEDVAFHEISSAPQQLKDPSLDQTTDHLDADGDRPEALEFDTNLAHATEADQANYDDAELTDVAEADQENYEDLNDPNDAALSEPTELVQEHGEPSAEGGRHHASAEMDDSEAEHLASYHGDVTILYNYGRYQLCAKEDNNDPDTYFFAQREELDYPLSRFLSCIREVISDEITPGHELCFSFKELQIRFGEESSQDFLKHTTFRDLLNLYARLQQNDGNNVYPEPTVELFTPLGCADRFSELLVAANEGTGLAESQNILDESGSSGYSSQVEDAAEDQHHYATHTEVEGITSNEQKGEDPAAEDDHLGYETAEIEGGLAEEPQAVDVGNDDVLMSSFEEVEQAGQEDGSGYIDDNATNAEDEIDYREGGDDEASYGAAHVDSHSVSEQGNIAEENNDQPVTDADGDSAIDESNGSGNYVDNDTDRPNESEQADELGDEIGFVLAEAASASATTAHVDSIVQPDSSLDVTGEPIHEGELDDHDVQAADIGAVENSAGHKETASNGLSIVEPREEINQVTVESPTSTIKGDEISYEDDQDLGDHLDIDLQEHIDSSEENLDEIDWDRDGNDERAEDIEEQDPNQLTPSSGSTKRGRQLDDSANLVNESPHVKRRRT